MKPTFQRIALAAVIGFGLVVSASAQDRAPASGGPQGPRGGDRQKLFEDMQHRREQRLHDLLQIKPDQEAAFRAFTTVLEQARPHRDHDRQGRDGSKARAQLTTPERLDRAAQRMAERQQRMQKTSAAVKTFYAALTPDQRKAFDAMPMPFGGDHGGFGHRGGFMRGRFEGAPLQPIR